MMRSFVKDGISYDSVASSLRSWSDCGVINMKREKIEHLRRTNPKQLTAIYWSYIRKWRDEKLDKKKKTKSFIAPRLVVTAPVCQQPDCDRAVVAYNYCLQHLQRFVTARYPEATAGDMDALLKTTTPRSFTHYGVIVAPVKPVTPPGAQTPSTTPSGTQNSSDQSNEDNDDSTTQQNQRSTTKNKNKNKKRQYQFDQVQEQQEGAPAKQQVEQLTKKVVDQLSGVFGQMGLRSLTGYGPPLKRRRRKQRSKKREQKVGPGRSLSEKEVQELGHHALRSLTNNDGYEQSAHVNWPGGGGQGYFTPYTAALEAERLLKKQAQVWAQEGMNEKEIKKRLQPFMDKVNKEKRKKKKKLQQPSPFEQSPDVNPQIKMP